MICVTYDCFMVCNISAYSHVNSTSRCTMRLWKHPYIELTASDWWMVLRRKQPLSNNASPGTCIIGKRRIEDTLSRPSMSMVMPVTYIIGYMVWLYPWFCWIIENYARVLLLYNLVSRFLFRIWPSKVRITRICS